MTDVNPHEVLRVSCKQTAQAIAGASSISKSALCNETEVRLARYGRFNLRVPEVRALDMRYSMGRKPSHGAYLAACEDSKQI